MQLRLFPGLALMQVWIFLQSGSIPRILFCTGVPKDIEWVCLSLYCPKHSISHAKYRQLLSLLILSLVFYVTHMGSHTEVFAHHGWISTSTDCPDLGPDLSESNPPCTFWSFLPMGIRPCRQRWEAKLHILRSIFVTWLRCGPGAGKYFHQAPTAHSCT